MSGGAGLGLALALASAVALNWGYVVQHGAAAGLPPLTLRRPLRSLRLLRQSRRWLAGFAVGIAGWAFYVAALELAPLSLVQATSAGGIGVLALLVHVAPGSPGLERREAAAVAVAVLGLALLGASLTTLSTPHRPPPAQAVVTWLVAVSLAAAVAAAAARLVAAPAAALGLAAGLLYAAGDVATKAALEPGRQLLVPAIFAAHGLAFVALQLGFQRGRALVTVGVATLVTNALPIAAGSLLFRERLPGGAAGDARLAAFALVTFGGALLVRSPATPSTALHPAL